MIPTCIDEFVLSDTPFVIREDRLFTLHKSGSRLTDNYISLSGMVYSLEESEEFQRLELDNYSFNFDFFEKYITKMFKDSIRQSKKDLRSLDNIFKKIQEDAIEKRILNQAMKDYFKGFIDDDNAAEEINIEINEQIDVPRISDLETTYSLMKQLYGKGILYFGGSVYSINDENISNIFINFEGKKNSLDLKCKMNDLMDSYRNIIQHHVLQEFKKKNGSIVNSLSKADDEKRRLNDEINSLKRNLDVSKTGDIGYRKKGDCYEVYIDISPFIYEFDNNFYKFGNTQVAISVQFIGDTVRLMDKPYIAEAFMPYNHPFVYTTSKICFGDEHYIEGRFEDKNIYFNKNYNVKKQNVSQRIAICLSEAKQVIEDGYIGIPMPVKSLNDINFKKELLSGLDDTRAKSIPKSRYFPEVSR